MFLKIKKHFLNDSDGLSIFDFLTLVFTGFYILFKIVCMVLIYITLNQMTITGLEHLYESVDNIMNTIILSYFGKKTLDNIVSKVSDTATNIYSKDKHDSNQDSVQEIKIQPELQTEEKETGCSDIMKFNG